MGERTVAQLVRGPLPSRCFTEQRPRPLVGRCARLALGWRREGDGSVHLDREIPEPPVVITLFPGRQQPSILSTGAFELADLPGKPLRDLLGLGLVEAGEDHQTDVRTGQKKLLEVINDGVEIAPFALSDQGRVNQFALAAFLVVEPSDIVEPFSIVAGVFHGSRTDFTAEFSANLAQFGLDGLGPLRIGPRFDDFKIVEALLDRAHGFKFSGHLETQAFLISGMRDMGMVASALQPASSRAVFWTARLGASVVTGTTRRMGVLPSLDYL